jgi:hypothetical protein
MRGMVAITSPTDTACIQIGLLPDNFKSRFGGIKPSLWGSPFLYFFFAIAIRKRGDERREMIKRSML